MKRFPGQKVDYLDERKKMLFKMVSEILRPLGFKKKGSRWTKHTADADVTIHLQESSWRYSFYVNAEYRFHEAPKTRVPDLVARIEEASFLDVESDENFNRLKETLPDYFKVEIVPKLLSIASLQSKAWYGPPIGAWGATQFLRERKPGLFGSRAGL